jgi:hypothetical protein
LICSSLHDKGAVFESIASYFLGASTEPYRNQKQVRLHIKKLVQGEKYSITHIAPDGGVDKYIIIGPKFWTNHYTNISLLRFSSGSNRRTDDIG